MKPTSRPNGEAAVLAKIAAMPAPYRAMGERLHALILRSAPASRSPRPCSVAQAPRYRLHVDIER